MFSPSWSQILSPPNNIELMIIFLSMLWILYEHFIYRNSKICVKMWFQRLSEKHSCFQSKASIKLLSRFSRRTTDGKSEQKSQCWGLLSASTYEKPQQSTKFVLTGIDFFFSHKTEKASTIWLLHIKFYIDIKVFPKDGSSICKLYFPYHIALIVCLWKGKHMAKFQKFEKWSKILAFLFRFFSLFYLSWCFS